MARVNQGAAIGGFYDTHRVRRICGRFTGEEVLQSPYVVEVIRNVFPAHVVVLVCPSDGRKRLAMRIVFI